MQTQTNNLWIKAKKEENGTIVIENLSELYLIFTRERVTNQSRDQLSVTVTVRAVETFSRRHLIPHADSAAL